MRAVRISAYGGPEVLTEVEIATPEPGPGEALVEVAAAGVNYIDVYHRTGRYRQPLPFVAGVEAVGVVRRVGAQVTEVRVGDRVGWANLPGAYAQAAVIPAGRLVPVPDRIDSETAAAVLLQGMTAHFLIRDSYRVRPGDQVLLHACAGGMGLALTQLITHAGATVIGTTSSEAKERLARAAGAAHVIRYDEPVDIAARVRELTGGRGVAAVYDGVGASTFDASLASLRPRGTLVLFGAASGAVAPFDPMRLAQAGSVTLTRPSLPHFIAERSELLERAQQVLDWVGDGTLAVQIGGRYPLAEAAQAHRDLESRRTSGKLLLMP
jgi:NADPH:quinone reductase